MEIIRPRMKQEIEDCYATILAPYATARPRENSRDIVEDNVETDNRGSFQRDRDRIIHTKAFRRLMYKTQVFVNHEGDHFRTRLTHTIEVAQFARGVCKSLALNEDLTEAIAYGHDLGHTPFGHAVEKYFGDVLKEKAGTRFYHNEQSVRVVDYLEIRSHKERGLNLTYEVREGIFKHNSDRSGIYANLLPDKPCSSLEGQVVSIVDTIAYICHDLEDGIKSGIVERAMNQNEDIKRNLDVLIEMVKEKTGIFIDVNPYHEPLFIRKLIHYLIEQLTKDSWNNINAHGVHTKADVDMCANQGITLIQFSEENRLFFREFKNKIYTYIYGSRTIELMDAKAVTLARNMFELYKKQPKLLPSDWYYSYQHIDNNPGYKGTPNSEVRVIIDYISTMTDRFALEENERLFNPSIKI